MTRVSDQLRGGVRDEKEQGGAAWKALSGFTQLSKVSRVKKMNEITGMGGLNGCSM